MTVDLRIRGKHVTTEARLATGDPDRLAENVAELAKAIAFMIAVGTRGDTEAMNTLLEGTSQLMFEVAADFSGVGALAAVLYEAGKKGQTHG